MQVLVSVRDVAEARLAAAAGVHFIDLKEPATGALGGLPPGRVAEVVAMLRGRPACGRISATIGDWPARDLAPILARARAVAACGVDYVKVGVADGPDATALVAALGGLQAEGLPVVPVFLADAGPAWSLLAQALGHGFPALMLDTQDKRGGSLLARWPMADLQRFVAQVQAAGRLAGLAGALLGGDVPALRRLAPDFAGFRSAVCAGDRAGALDAGRLAALLALLADGPGPAQAAALAAHG